MGVNISISTLQVSELTGSFGNLLDMFSFHTKRKKSRCYETGFNFVSLGLVKKGAQNDETRFKTIQVSYHYA